MNIANSEPILVVGRGYFVSAMLQALQPYGASHIHVVMLDSCRAEAHQLVSLVRPWTGPADSVSFSFLLNVENIPANLLESCLATRTDCKTVFYVTSSDDPLPEMKCIQKWCQANGRTLYPAVLLSNYGIAGPIGNYNEDNALLWTEVWRTIHESDISTVADLTPSERILAQLLASSWQDVLRKQRQPGDFYRLNLDTLEGRWYSSLFAERPSSPSFNAGLENQDTPLAYLSGIDQRELSYSLSLSGSGHLHYEEPAWMKSLAVKTCPVQGLFHVWDEGDLEQLPLHQCRVQSVDPMSEGPASLLDEQVFSGLTALEARREAALGGMQAFAERWLQAEQGHAGFTIKAVGVGFSPVESGYRAVRELLRKRWNSSNTSPFLSLLPISSAVLPEHKEVQYCLEGLSIYDIPFTLFAGKDIYDFPIAAIHIVCSEKPNGFRFHRADFTWEGAWREVLKQALHSVQRSAERIGSGASWNPSPQAVIADSNSKNKSQVKTDEDEIAFDHPPPEQLVYEMSQNKTMPTLQEVQDRFRKNGERLVLLSLNLGPYFAETDGCFFTVAASSLEKR